MKRKPTKYELIQCKNIRGTTDTRCQLCEFQLQCGGLNEK